MVLGSGPRLTLLGLLLGLCGAFPCSRSLAAAIAGVRPDDALACRVPARRAARVDPMVALGDG